ncbi:MAG: HAMP domain-containing protein [Anaerolineae bacterium]|nr:HAMP domain-containing protein [Anaerolineae bacterium]
MKRFAVPFEVKSAFLAGMLMVGMAIVLMASNQNRFLAGIAILLGVGLTVFVVSREVMRLGPLNQAMSRLAQGDVAVRVEPQTGDQVGQLAVAFNEMCQAIQGREQAWAERANALEHTVADLNHAALEWQRRSKTEAELLEATRKLTSPAVPVFQGMIVLPLVGQISQERVELITANLLTGIETYDAQVAIIDITGVPQVDEQSALALLRAARAAELMGCRSVLTGLRPEFAQALVRLDVNTGNLVTRSDLEDGMMYGLASLGFEVSKTSARRGSSSAAR